jgi:hypothetical protein
MDAYSQLHARDNTVNWPKRTDEGAPKISCRTSDHVQSECTVPSEISQLQERFAAVLLAA